MSEAKIREMDEVVISEKQKLSISMYRPPDSPVSYVTIRKLVYNARLDSWKASNQYISIPRKEARRVLELVLHRVEADKSFKGK